MLAGERLAVTPHDRADGNAVYNGARVVADDLAAIHAGEEPDHRAGDG